MDDWGAASAAEQWTDAETCAQRMGITLPELDDLARRGAVRARRAGWSVEYMPCIVNVDPKPAAKTPATKAVRKNGQTRRAPSKTGPRQP